MKAIVYARSGWVDLLKCDEVDKPDPTDDEVLIKVRAVSVNPMDEAFLKHSVLRRLMSGRGKGRTAQPGRDLAGEVEAVGKNVTHFKVGDEVFGCCGGAFAEYACASTRALALKPPNVTFEQAASISLAGITALQGLRDKGKIQTGYKILINGAAGGVGTFAVQIAKSFEAEVTGVCSTRNVEMVRSMGADHVIDYTRQDFTQSGERYDLLFDLVANHSLTDCRRVLNPTGMYIGAGVIALGGSIAALMRRLLKTMVLSWFGSQKLLTLTAKLTQADLATLGELMANGKITPVIDRRSGLNEIPEAVRFVGEGHARGKVVISV